MTTNIKTNKYHSISQSEDKNRHENSLQNKSLRKTFSSERPISGPDRSDLLKLAFGIKYPENCHFHRMPHFFQGQRINTGETPAKQANRTAINVYLRQSDTVP